MNKIIIIITAFLSLASFSVEARDMTAADFTKPFFGLKQQGRAAQPKQVPLVVVAWEPKLTGLATRLASGDFNGDGRADSVVVNRDLYDRFVVRVMEHGPGGNARLLATVKLVGSIHDLAMADYNGDGRDDVVLAFIDNSERITLLVYEQGAGTTLRRIGEERLQGKQPMIDTGDIDGDGEDDIVLTSIDNSNRIAVMVYKRGTGVGMTRISDLRNAGKPVGIATGDVIGDGREEVILTSIDNSNRIAVMVFERGTGMAMSRIGDVRIAGKPAGLATGDMNGDGRDEVILTSIDNSNRIAVMVYQRGTGMAMTRIGDERVAGRYRGIAAGDLNNDGSDELVLTSIDGGNRTAVMAYRLASGMAMQRIGDSRFSGSGPLVTLGDYDADGRQDVALVNAEGTDRLELSVFNRLMGSPWRPLTHNTLDGAAHFSATELMDLLWGSNMSVDDWIVENSLGRYRLTPHPVKPVIGPVQSRYPWPFYWRDASGYVQRYLLPEESEQNPYKVPPDNGNPRRKIDSEGKVVYLDNEGYLHGSPHAWAEELRAADGAIDFNLLDRDKDKKITPDEAVILAIKAQGKVFGTRRGGVLAREHPNEEFLKVGNGIIVTSASELYIWPQPTAAELRSQVATAIEELLHQSTNLADQYTDEGKKSGTVYRKRNDPRIPGQFALTTSGGRPVHIDAFHKLKWGWLNPQVVNRSGRYTIRQTSTNGDALILFNLLHGADEFFVLENRWRGTSYDQYRDAAMGEGLILWQCIQNPDLRHDWARRAVHLRMADPSLDANGRPDWTQAPFDGAVAARSYDLTDDSKPQNLRFSDNHPSYIKIRNISNAGQTMTVDVELPPRVAIRSVQSNKYVRAGIGRDSVLGATSDQRHDWETFRLIDLGDGRVALQSDHSGKYVRAGLGKNTQLGAVSDRVAGWETFRKVDLPGGNFALQSLQNGRYVRAGVGPNSLLAASSPHIKAWESFRLVMLDP